jgi:hypothetical protein
MLLSLVFLPEITLFLPTITRFTASFLFPSPKLSSLFSLANLSLKKPTPSASTFTGTEITDDVQPPRQPTVPLLSLPHPNTFSFRQRPCPSDWRGELLDFFFTRGARPGSPPVSPPLHKILGQLFPPIRKGRLKETLNLIILDTLIHLTLSLRLGQTPNQFM